MHKFKINASARSTIKTLALGAFAILVLLALIYFLYRSFAPAGSDQPGQAGQPSQAIACTLEAKICPDGSAVGRSGPDCQFAACPETSGSAEASPEDAPVPEDWATYTDEAQGFSFRYPAQLAAQYISLVSPAWPPRIMVTESTEVLDCTETPATGSQAGRTRLQTINSRSYCVIAYSEGAAGSVFTDHTYIHEDGKNRVTVNFTLRYPQCSNYDEPQRTACADERTSFDLDALVDQIVRTIKNR
ncbi:MAG: hypothetical protein WC456_00965 [Patescibacteria group bacterium]